GDVWYAGKQERRVRSDGVGKSKIHRELLAEEANAIRDQRFVADARHVIILGQERHATRYPRRAAEHDCRIARNLPSGIAPARPEVEVIVCGADTTDAVQNAEAAVLRVDVFESGETNQRAGSQAEVWFLYQSNFR